MTRRLWRLISICVLAALMVAPAIPVGATIATPNTFTVATVEAYQNCIETGDQLYLVTGTINYTVNPTEGTAADLFLVRLMDGTTELKSVTPYAFYDDGYDYFVQGLYFSAAEVTALGMGWGAGEGYVLRLDGNPALSWTASPVPSISIATFDTWYSGVTIAATDLTLTLHIRTLALTTENTWGVALTEFVSGVRKLNTTGEDYFTTVVPNLRTMCPTLFTSAIYQPQFPDKGLVNIGYTGGDDANTTTYGVNWIAQTFTANDTFDIAGVYFKYLRAGSPGDITASIRATNAGAPNGADLVSGTLDSSGGSTAGKGVFDSVIFSTITTLTKNTQYTIVLRATAGNIANYISFRKDTTGAYSGGQMYVSGDSGGTWNAEAASDLMFTIIADQADSQGWIQQWEGRLLGTPFDLTDLANAAGMPRLLMGTIIWFFLSIAVAVLATRRAQNYAPALGVGGLVFLTGGVIGFTYAILAVGIPTIMLLGAAYAHFGAKAGV